MNMSLREHSASRKADRQDHFRLHLAMPTGPTSISQKIILNPGVRRSPNRLGSMGKKTVSTPFSIYREDAVGTTVSSYSGLLLHGWRGQAEENDIHRGLSPLNNEELTCYVQKCSTAVHELFATLSITSMS